MLHEDYATDIIPGYRLEILSGFRFECSIPRLFWFTTGHPLTPRYQASALIHDANYRAELMPRKDADDLLYECLRLDGVKLYLSNKIWLGVRAGGGVVWWGHTAESVAKARMYCYLVPKKG